MNHNLTDEQKERITAWVRALRSGQYQQTSGTLRRRADGYGYCCLGVACEISGLGRWDTNCDETWYGDANRYGSETVLPRFVADWYGIDPNPELDGRCASQWNDEEHYNFDQIADLIEHEFLADE